MAAQHVQAMIDVKSEGFHQTLEESVLDSSTKEPSSSYQGLIAANERLKANISKILTEFVNKARLEQEANGDQKKRKIKHDDEDGEDLVDNDDEEEEDNDADPSDDNEEEQE